MGYTLDVGIKHEFFLFDLDENGEPTNQSSERGGYFDIGPSDGGENTRRDMVLYLADMGMKWKAPIIRMRRRNMLWRWHTIMH